MEKTQQEIFAQKKVVMVVGLDGEPKCDHNWILQSTGGFHFSAGEVWDDIKTKTICRDCKVELTDEPVNCFDISEDEIPNE